MSESKRKRLEAARLAATLKPAVSRIAAALRNYATAASNSLGSDCYVHAELGRVLLNDVGIETRLVAGFAAWRVGPGADDVLGHVPHLTAYAPTKCPGLPYHTWLYCGAFLVDFTTYQLQQKARQLDAADGGRTTVTWCPPFLCALPQELRRYEELVHARTAGLAYYQARPELDGVLRPPSPVDPAHVSAVRLLLADPDMNVIRLKDLGA
mgnify:CR=1 FL=1